jgi:regulatory protein
MPRVSDIQAQKNGQFYSIFVDDKYAFSLGDLELSASSLRIGSELTEAEVEQWVKSSGLSKLRNRALHYISIRPRAELEIRLYLKRKLAEPEETEEVIVWLRNYNYLDDADFAKRWAEHRRELGHRSDLRIRAELRQKGIDDATIDEALQSDVYDQAAALKALIEKRRHRYADEQKLIQYLARQGFSWSQIKDALKAED